MFGNLGINFNQRPFNQLDKIIDLPLGEGEPDGSCKTTVVSLHLAQMIEWGARGGNVQFKAVQDYKGKRKEYIAEWVAENNIKKRIEPCMARMIAKGEVLQVVRPSLQKKTGYKFDYYVGGKNNPKPNYYVFYIQDEYGEDVIECVVIKSSKEYAPQAGMLGNAYDISGNPLKKWRLEFIDKYGYISFNFQQEPQNLRNTYALYRSFMEGNSFIPYAMEPPVVVDNPFAPEFPFEICANIPLEDGEPGCDDFYQIKDLIEDHNSLLLDAQDNLSVFSNPTMVSSRPAESVVEDIERYSERRGWTNTYAESNGFVSPFNRYRSITYKMPKVVGNVKEGERFGYIEQPDTISGDHNLFIRQLRELIHWTLGGVDPLGISASATFGEIKSLFGRIENTAAKKAETLFGSKGLCSLISKIILAEERKCKIAIANFIISQYLQGSQLAAEMVQQELTDEQFRALYVNITEELGLELPGLPPLGKRDCSWRYTKDVFQRTSQEQQEYSIVYRNEREDGISQEMALGKLYPNMSDDEIRQSMSGFSPRVVTNALSGIAGALQLYMQLSQLPSPENPNISWAQALGIGGIVEQGIITLQKEMNFNIPDFKEEPNYDEINLTINQTLQQLQNTNGSSLSTSTQLPNLPGSSSTTLNPYATARLYAAA